MEKIHILVDHTNLITILSNILEILGFLPVIINEDIITKKNKEVKNIIFTNYYYAKYKVNYLKQFKTIIIFIPSGTSFLETNLEFKNNQVLYFNETLTVSNVRDLIIKI